MYVNFADKTFQELKEMTIYQVLSVFQEISLLRQSKKIF